MWVPWAWKWAIGETFSGEYCLQGFSNLKFKYPLLIGSHQNIYYQEQLLLLMQQTEQGKRFLPTCDSPSCQHLYRAKLRDRSWTCWSANGCCGEFGVFYVLACKVLMLPMTAWLPWLLVSRTLTSVWGATAQFSSILDASTWTFP